MKARDFDWDAPRQPKRGLFHRSGVHLVWMGEPESYERMARWENPGAIHDTHGAEPTCGHGLCLTHVRSVPPFRPDYPPFVCVYCGSPADTVDHLRSRGWTGDRTRANVAVVPACRLCNSLLGDTFAYRVPERRDIVHRKLRTRFSSLLQVVVYGESDLDEMGYALREAGEDAIARHEELVRRLAWPNDPEYDVKAYRHHPEHSTPQEGTQ